MINDHFDLMKRLNGCASMRENVLFLETSTMSLQNNQIEKNKLK